MSCAKQIRMLKQLSLNKFYHIHCTTKPSLNTLLKLIIFQTANTKVCSMGTKNYTNKAVITNSPSPKSAPGNKPRSNNDGKDQ